MARMSRLAVAGQPHLVVQRCRDVPVFRDDTDRLDYLDVLRDLARDGSVAVHAYALVGEGVLLLMTPRSAPELGRFMQRLNRRFVSSHRRRHGGEGPLWAGRFHAAVIEPERYLLRCVLVIEQAPVRAGAVASADEWPWSSAAHHLGRRPSDWLVAHPVWWQLGNTPFEREATHAIALQRLLGKEHVRELFAAAQGGWMLGSAPFIEAINAGGRRPVRPRPRGRPRVVRAVDKSVPN